MIPVYVCLSRGSTRFHCAQTAEQIKILFGVNTPGGPRNIVLDEGLDPPTVRRCSNFVLTDVSFLQIVGTFSPGSHFVNDSICVSYHASLDCQE